MQKWVSDRKLNDLWPPTKLTQSQQSKQAINPPGSSSLLVMSCSDVTSCSSGAWITKRMLPSRHSKQPNFPITFSTSPSRWEDKIALKCKEKRARATLWVSTSVQLCLFLHYFLCAAGTWWGHSELPAESPEWLEQTCRQQSCRPLLLPLQRHQTNILKFTQILLSFAEAVIRQQANKKLIKDIFRPRL